MSANVLTARSDDALATSHKVLAAQPALPRHMAMEFEWSQKMPQIEIWYLVSNHPRISIKTFDRYPRFLGENELQKRKWFLYKMSHIYPNRQCAVPKPCPVQLWVLPSPADPLQAPHLQGSTPFGPGTGRAEARCHCHLSTVALNGELSPNLNQGRKDYKLSIISQSSESRAPIMLLICCSVLAVDDCKI